MEIIIYAVLSLLHPGHYDFASTLPETFVVCFARIDFLFRVTFIINQAIWLMITGLVAFAPTFIHSEQLGRVVAVIAKTVVAKASLVFALPDAEVI